MSAGPIEFPVEGIADERLRLRLACDADHPAFIEACQDPAIQRYTTVPYPYGEAEATEFERDGALELAEGRAVALTIADADTDALLGAVALRCHASDRGRWSIGYWIAPWARGGGVATRAVILLSRYGFEQLGALRIELWAEPENEASMRVAERAGFQREGLMRSYVEINDERHDVYMYSLLPGELH